MGHLMHFYQLLNRLKSAGRNSRKRESSKTSKDYQCLESRQLLASIVGNDYYSAIGNTTLNVNTIGDFEDVPSVKVTGSVFDNDAAGVTLISYDASNTLGDVQLESDGSFVYQPPLGITDIIDSFTYTASDGGEIISSG